MKFSSTLQFNAVPEWRGNYIDYDHLKQLVFRLKRAELPVFREEFESFGGSEPSTVFCDAVRAQVCSIDAFYKQIEDDAFKGINTLNNKLKTYFESNEYRDSHLYSLQFISSRHTSPLGPTTNYQPSSSSQQTYQPLNSPDALGSDNLVYGTAASISSDDEAEPGHNGKPSVHEHLAHSQSVQFKTVSLKQEICRSYVLLNDLLRFSDLNQEGVRKALKKFDKVHGTTILPGFMSHIGNFYIFSVESSSKIDQTMDFLVTSFAKITNQPKEVAAESLSSTLRDHVVFERNTVWRELIDLERQAHGFQQTNNLPLTPGTRAIKLRFSLLGIRIALGVQFLKLLIIFITFMILLLSHPLESEVQSRCLAIVTLSSLLWATESLPLYVTSLLVPILVVVMKIPVDSTGQPLSAKEASAFVFARMWSPVIMVLLGGFTLAAALSKYNIAKALAQTILNRVGSDSPRRVLLSLMFVAAFLCMWISNVAAPVLLYSVTQPILRILPSGDPFNKALILGIALASNVGGISSPIASPQNILALHNMEPAPTWIEWFAISIPVTIVSIVAIWGWLCLTFPITKEAREAITHTKSTGSVDVSQFGTKHYFVLSITIITIIIWCFTHQLEPYFGDMGILALVPLVLLFGSNILNAADFNNFLWTIVALAMGGIVLGQSVESCGLLATVADTLQRKVSHMPLLTICMTFGLAILFVASFISHTVAALIILPLVKSIGEQLNDPHPRLLVVISAFLCSGAMALPTSGFPNVTAVCMVDEFGKQYLSALDFISRGVPASFIVYFASVTVGYAICRLLGF